MSEPEHPIASTNIPQPSHNPPKLLTLQDGTLCTFCDDVLANPPRESGAPFRTRTLASLLQASTSCGYCAMWLRALEATAQELKDERQDEAAEMHPLLQKLVEPNEVHLQFIHVHDWGQHSIGQRIAWPHLGTIWATLDMVKAQNARHINAKPLAPSDQEEATWQMVEGWLARCDSTHGLCKYPKDPSWKPSRLLHITVEPLQVRLVEGDDIPIQVDYLTLSHCWGGAIPMSLTGDTLPSFKTSIPIEALPQNFQDACNIVKTLGHQYLWIDSLCIIQDDSEDWAIEAGRMASVYGSSWLNISAAASSNSNDGIFHSQGKHSGEAWMPIWVQRKWGGDFSGTYCVSDLRGWWSRLNNAPLNRRGWVVQERLLSPRVLHLGLEQVAFECCCMSACERLPLGDLGGEFGHGSTSRVKQFILGARCGDLKDLTVEQLLGDWNEVVRSYSMGGLTFDTDKLVALGGIVDCFERVFRGADGKLAEDQSRILSEGDSESNKARTSKEQHNVAMPQRTFLAGLWRPFLELQLVWRATSRVQHHQLSGNAPPAPGQRPAQYIAPTWSWCSVNNALVEPQHPRTIDIIFARVLDAKIVPLPELKAGQTSSGLKYCSAPGSYLRLQCSILPIAGYGGTEGLKFFDFAAGEGSAITVDSKNYWDVAFEEEAMRCSSPFAVPVFVDQTRVVNPLHGLVLDSREDEQGRPYAVRVGAFVLERPQDVKAFWAGVKSFDDKHPGTRGLCDGVFRLVPSEGKTEYVQEDGVVQRIVDIH
ncbi:hypothetical protein ACJ41O_003174 [Fusarium nematophilum]